jgi:hypothetical protein
MKSQRRKQMDGKPKVITICGSSKFCEIMAVIGWLIEKREKAIVMGLHLLPWWYNTKCKDHLAEHECVALEMDELHLRKIDISDEIFVVDFNFYIGSSTKNEISYTTRMHKTVRYLTCESDLYQEILNIMHDASVFNRSTI